MIHQIKWPLILTLVVIVVRILLEEMGAPGAISNIFSVAWLAFLIPIYFAVGRAASAEAHPYKALAKLIVLYGVGVRLMVAVSYSLAYLFQWSAPRFSGGGIVGEGVTALQGLLLMPAFNLVPGLIMAIGAGLLVGPAALAIRRKMLKPKVADENEETPGTSPF
ncbi:MAG: hypothetical protein IH917_02125 [Acidobacteria bacterium]|nr:hypothetical protein [Acidobacteriota bacterium]